MTFGQKFRFELTNIPFETFELLTIKCLTIITKALQIRAKV